MSSEEAVDPDEDRASHPSAGKSMRVMIGGEEPAVLIEAGEDTSEEPLQCYMYSVDFVIRHDGPGIGAEGGVDAIDGPACNLGTERLSAHLDGCPSPSIELEFGSPS
jgi:hypothetical protein